MGIFLAKKGQTFNTYSEEFKLGTVRAYVEGPSSYELVADGKGFATGSS